METPFEVGDRIQYKLFGKDGKEHWFDGVIHGVRRYEDAATNTIISIKYLVDTGRDVRVDEHHVNARTIEINKRLNESLRKGATVDQAINRILKHTDLPEDKTEVVLVRQPEQIELPAEFIKPA